MKKIEEIKKRFERARAEKASLSAELDALMKQEAEARDKAEAAAENGDVDGYSKFDAERQRAAAAVYVKRKQLDKMSDHISAEEILAAWEEYAADYDKSFRKKLDEYKKARKDLSKKYMELVSLQNDALAVREYCAAISDFEESVDRLNMAMLPDNDANGMRYVGPGGRYAINALDPIFFLNAGDLLGDCTEMLNAVVRLHRAFGK